MALIMLIMWNLGEHGWKSLKLLAKEGKILEYFLNSLNGIFYSEQSGSLN